MSIDKNAVIAALAAAGISLEAAEKLAESAVKKAEKDAEEAAVKASEMSLTSGLAGVQKMLSPVFAEKPGAVLNIRLPRDVMLEVFLELESASVGHKFVVCEVRRISIDVNGVKQPSITVNERKLKEHKPKCTGSATIPVNGACGVCKRKVSVTGAGFTRQHVAA